MPAANLDVTDIYGELIRLIMAEPGKVLGLSAIGLAPSWVASLISELFLWSAIVLLLSLPLVALAHGGVVVLIRALRNGSTMGFSALLSGPRDGFVRITLALALISLILGLGFILLLVPGFVALAYLWVAWPLVVLEDAPALGAIRESARMTAGYRVKITGLVLVFVVLNIGLGVVQTILGAIFGFAFALGASALIGTATTALALALITLSYLRLKESQGGVTDVTVAG